VADAVAARWVGVADPTMACDKRRGVAVAEPGKTADSVARI